MMDDLDRALLDAYRAPLEAELNPDGPVARMLAQVEAERERRRAAMTPEQRELEDLRNEVANLRERLAHATKALAGDDCGYGDY